MRLVRPSDCMALAFERLYLVRIQQVASVKYGGKTMPAERSCAVGYGPTTPAMAASSASMSAPTSFPSVPAYLPILFGAK